MQSANSCNEHGSSNQPGDSPGGDSLQPVTPCNTGITLAQLPCPALLTGPDDSQPDCNSLLLTILQQEIYINGDACGVLDPIRLLKLISSTGDGPVLLADAGKACWQVIRENLADGRQLILLTPAVPSPKPEVTIAADSPKSLELIDSLAVPVLLTDENDRIIHANPACSTLLNQNSADIQGSQLGSLLSWTADPPAELQSGLSPGLGQIRQPGGQTMLVSLARQSIELDDIGQRGFLISIEDVTQSQLAWQVIHILSSLRQASSRYSALPEMLALVHTQLQAAIAIPNFYVAIYHADSASYSFPYWSDTQDAVPGQTALGDSLTEHVRASGRHLYIDDVPAMHAAGLKLSTAPARQVCSWCGVPLTIGGSVIGVLVVQDHERTGQLTSFDLDLLLFICGMLSLLMGRVESERRLQESTLQFRNIAANVKEGLGVIDEQGRLQYTNPALLRMLGQSADIAGRRLSEVMSHNERFKLDVYLRRICRGEQLSFELSMPAANHQDRNMLVSSGPCGVVDGKPTFFVLFQDISSIRRAEAEKMRLMEQILSTRHLERLAMFAGGISHEFNNILQVIRANAEVAQFLPPSGDNGTANLSGIINSTDRASSLVGQLLTFSRNQLDERDHLRIGDLLESVLEKQELSAEQRARITLERLTASDKILADELQIEQMLWQLIHNSLLSIPEAGGRVFIRLRDPSEKELDRLPRPGQDADNWILLEIEDNGVGIPGEHIDRIFDPFFTTRTVGQGHGLGLAIVYGIVNSHDGVIWASPARENGTRMNVLLPRQKAVRAAGPTESKPAGKRVLLVDDEEIIVRLGTRLLGRLGIDVQATCDPHEARELLTHRAGEFSLLITDQNMPDCDGLDLAALARRCNPDINILLCTGYSANLDEDELRKLGIHSVLVKPFDIHELSERVLRLLPQDRPLSADA